MDINYSVALKEFDGELAMMNMRGQWLADPARRDSVAEPQGSGARTEPKPAGVPYLWRWEEVYPKLLKACEALPESFTARRALAFKNPELPRCAAQTLGMAIQVIRPGEVAWAHRHTIAAIRFVIRGNADLITVVNGVAYQMLENDLVLTPNWTWHDHRNNSNEVAFWLDVLDVPFVGGMNMGFYEEFGNSTQPITENAYHGSKVHRPIGGSLESPEERACRFPWHKIEPALYATNGTSCSKYDGVLLEYVNRKTSGATLPTLSCQIQRLVPSFSGLRHRHSSSTVFHVVAGEGTTEAGGKEMHWSARDCFVVPNWTWHRHLNHSQTKEAILFSVSDSPALRALGFYREEIE